MKKNLGILSLMLITGSVFYILYWYLTLTCSIKRDNILHVPFEPSGMQFIVYIISFPIFLILASLSQIHSYYFDLQKSLFPGVLVIWVSYPALLFYADFFHSSSNNILYYGGLFLAALGILYISYITCCQLLQLFEIKIEG